jgi:hypothetical protein
VPEPTHIDHDGPGDRVPQDRRCADRTRRRRSVARAPRTVPLRPAPDAAEYVGLAGGTAAAGARCDAFGARRLPARVLPLLDPDEAAQIGARSHAFTRRRSVAVRAVPHARDIGPEHVLVSTERRSGRRAGLGGAACRRPGRGLRVAPARDARTPGEARAVGYGGSPDPAFRTRGGAVRYALMPFPRGPLRVGHRPGRVRGERIEGVRRRARWLET